MASPIIEIDYADLPYISDRTARSILKDLSKAIRRAQAAEVEYFILSAGLSQQQIQSIRDRMRRPLQEAPAYYLEDLHAGSLWGKITISGFALWLLSATVGETVKDAWKETQIHNAIIEYVQGSRIANFENILRSELRNYAILTGRARIKSVFIEDIDGQQIIKIVITSTSSEINQYGERIEDEEIIAHSKLRLEWLHEEDEDDDDSKT